MADFNDLIQKHSDLPVEEQVKAGKPIHGEMDAKPEEFLQQLMVLLDRKEIIASDAQSMLKRDVYDALPQEWKDQVDLALTNIAEQVRLIEDFYRSEETPNASPQLQTMIEYLWQMKQRIEKTHDVFKF